MLITEEVAACDIRKKLREERRVCNDESAAVPTTIVDVNELAREDIEMIRKNATTVSQQTKLETKLVKIWAADPTIHRQFMTEEYRIKL